MLGCRHFPKSRGDALLAASPTAASLTAASLTAASPTAASPTGASPTAASPTAASPTAASPTVALLATGCLAMACLAMGCEVKKLDHLVRAGAAGGGDTVLLVGSASEHDGADIQEGDAWAARVDGDGETRCSVVVGTSGLETANAIAAGGDGSAAFVGTITDADGPAPFVVRLEPEGAVKWQRRLVMPAGGHGHLIVGLADGRYAVAASTSSDLGATVALAWFDAEGLLQAQNALAVSGSAEPMALRVIGDGGVLMVANVVTGGALAHGWIVRFDPAGSISWQRDLGGAGLDLISDALIGPDDRIHVVGVAQAAGGVTGSIWLAELDDTGTLLRQTAVAAGGATSLPLLGRDADSFFVVTSTIPPGGNDANLGILRFDDELSLTSQLTFGGQGEERPVAILGGEEGVVVWGVSTAIETATAPADGGPLPVAGDAAALAAPADGPAHGEILSWEIDGDGMVSRGCGAGESANGAVGAADLRATDSAARRVALSITTATTDAKVKQRGGVPRGACL